MAVKITLKNLDVSNQASLMNNATITGKDVEVEMEGLVLKDNVSVLDMANIEQEEPTPEPPKQEKKMSGLRRRVASLCENVAANFISDALTKK